MKNENRSHKLSHKLDEIEAVRSRKNQNVSISSGPNSVYDSVAYDPVKTRLSESENQPIARPGIEHCHWFILPLLLATRRMQFSLDHKRRSHKQNQSSAFVGLIFTRSYYSTLLITTPTTTPSLVKTSL